MPREVTITFADGESIVMAGVPDNATPEQVAGRARNQFGKVVTAIDGGKGESQAMHLAKLVPSALIRGAATLPAVATEATLNTPLQFAGPFAPFSLLNMQLKGLTGKTATEHVKAFGRQPKNTSGEKYLNAGLEGLGGALAGPGGLAAPVRTGLPGLGAGLGSEAAGRLSNEDPTARMLGGLAGGLSVGTATSLASRARPQTANLAREATEGLTPEAAKKAMELQALARAQGVDLDAAQALGAVGAPNSNITTLRNVLANSASGDKVKATLRQQPLQLEQLATVTEAGLPGPVLGRNAAANRVSAAATETLDMAKKARTAAVQGDYAKAGVVPEAGIRGLIKTIDDMSAAPGASQALRSTAADLRARLQELRTVSPNGVPALDVNTAISDAMGAYKGSPTYLANPLGTGQVKRLGATLNKQFQTLSPEVRAAEAKYAEISRNVVNPLKQGPVGQVAGRAGYLEDKQAPSAVLEAIFKRGGDPQVPDSAREIPVLLQKLRKADPEAVPGAVKEFVRSRMNSAFEAAPGNTVSAPIGAKESAETLYNSLFKTTAQAQGMRDMVAGSARSMGLSSKEVDQAVRGMENFAQITKALRNTSATDGMNWKDVAQLGGRSTLADSARVFSFLPINRLGDRIEEATLAKTFRQFDEVLTSPNGLQMLQELARVPPMSAKAIVILGTFGGTLPNVGGEKPTEYGGILPTE